MKNNKEKTNSFGFSLLKSITKYFKENSGILIGVLLMIVLLTITSDRFLKTANWINILRTISTNIFLGAGVMLTLIIGGIDLSVGMVVAMSGVITGQCIANYNLPIIVAILCGSCAGLLIGMLNGTILSLTSMPPFIVTLATQNIAKGIAYLVCNGTPIRIENETFELIGMGYFYDIPLPVMYSIILLFVIYILLSHTKFGSQMYAIGGNRRAANFAGINVRKISFVVYSLSGLFAGMAGVVLAARMSSGQPTVGVGYEGDAIAAVVLGGASMMGGSGKVGGLLLGALLIGILSNGLNLLNINAFWQYVVKGIVIIVAVYIDTMRKKSKGLSA